MISDQVQRFGADINAEEGSLCAINAPRRPVRIMRAFNVHAFNAGDVGVSAK